MGPTMNGRPVLDRQLQERAPASPVSSRAAAFGDLSFVDEENPASSALTELPNEVIVAIADQFSLLDPNDLSSLQALALTCRKMSGIVSDKTRLRKVFKERIPEVVKRLPQYEWDTMRHAALVNTFSREADQLIYGIMAPAVYDKCRWDFGFPVEGWHNIVDMGILLHAKMMGFGERTSLGYSSFSTLSPVEKLVLVYSALLWQEIYQLHIAPFLSGDDIRGPDQSSILRSAFIFEGPKFLTKMCHGCSKDASEMYRTAKKLCHKRDYPSAEEIEKNVKEWAKKSNIEEGQTFKDIGVGEEGRKTLLECLQKWGRMYWRDMPWYGWYHT
ncbi:hypothetical protein LTR70_002723 [Exophiala xenobiotica]|uniref:F-box domain-containing protein n=1 Tax=Lithohypha guttulata TaxID=1690604 RepID=A0ABR0KJS9_9EURO|nr:hypothetical protein LTR24_001829 [Lithohypha guttulata]KAK5324649.1 hypothetical protein LTR70_002723 [Exophiala xenobiotica]